MNYEEKSTIGIILLIFGFIAVASLISSLLITKTIISEVTLMSMFIHTFFILGAFMLISLVDKKPPKNRTAINLIKTYWSECLLIIIMIISSHFFILGSLN